MNATVFAALVRHVLTAVGGGFAVSWGIDGETMNGIIGALATLAGIGWAIWDKRK